MTRPTSVGWPGVAQSDAVFMKQMAPCDRTEMTAKELVMLDSSNEKSLAVFAIITWKHLACWVFPTHAPQILPIRDSVVADQFLICDYQWVSCESGVQHCVARLGTNHTRLGIWATIVTSES